MEHHTQYRSISTPPAPYSWTTLTSRASSAPATVRSSDVVVYDRLRCMASQYLRREGPVHPFEPSDLVHEVFVRMARSEAPACFQTLEHFFAVCAVVMRHILIDHARSATIFNRSRRVPLETDLWCEGGSPGNTLAMRQALQRLARRSIRLYRIVVLHVFKDLTFQEVGAALAISSRTVKRGWREALDYLRDELEGTPDSPLCLESALPAPGPDRRARREFGPSRSRPEQR
jgi:RNA polymerase sigma factor (TIGR02999 family)